MHQLEITDGLSASPTPRRGVYASRSGSSTHLRSFCVVILEKCEVGVDERGNLLGWQTSLLALSKQEKSQRGRRATDRTDPPIGNS
ncbi:hypothetical protein [Bradyrhizobium sp. CCBAU 53380]|uniref:hypothetical protein n=1 Tax=Bradyrhizobium sp. CCBAU 53380 TaxID=1325117 RepID=UPI0023027DBE|nr:hypothetical protein [Bradyrhizobium sp. CCBAU 53380]